MLKKRTPERKYLFAVDGIPGAGKTTATQSIAKILGEDAELRQSMSLYKKTRKIPQLRKMVRKISSPLLMQLAPPLAAVAGLKETAKKKKITFMDRSPLSILFYGGTDKKMSEKEIRKKASRWADFYKGKIDTIFLMDAETELAHGRISERDKELGMIKQLHTKEAIDEAARRYKIAADEFKKQGYDIQVIKVTPEITREQAADEIIKRMQEKMKKA